MKYRCACLELDHILDDPDLAAHISENLRYTSPGFCYDYELCTFDGGMEFTRCLKSESGQIQTMGVDMHFSSNNVWNIVADTLIDDTSLSHEYFVRTSESSAQKFPVRIMSPDILADIKPGDRVRGQVAAFASQGTVLKDQTADTVIRAVDDHAVTLVGKIHEVYEETFTFGDIQRAYIEMDVGTELGNISVIILPKNLEGTPKIDDDIVLTAYISIDPALPYSYIQKGPFHEEENWPNLPGDTQKRDFRCGCIRDHHKAMTVLSQMVKKGMAIRFGRCCADRVKLVDVDGSEQELERWAAVTWLEERLSKFESAKKILNIQNRTEHFADGILFDQGLYGILETNESGLVEAVTLLPAEGYTSDTDTEKYLLTVLADALCYGKLHRLQAVLHEKCIYRSDFSGKSEYGVKAILETLREVYSNLDEATAYSYEVVSAQQEILTDNCDDLPGIYSGNWCIRLWQKCEKTMAAAVFLRYNEAGQIINILLSRNGEYLKTYTQKRTSEAVKQTQRSVRELLRKRFGEENTFASMQRNDIPAADEEGAYVWQKADWFIRNWFAQNGYRIDTAELFDDCLGYGCTRKGEDYAVYVYAYGERKTAMLDGDYCAKLREHALSKNKTILVIYLHVTEEVNEDGSSTFFVGRYGSKDDAPEVWKLGKIGEKNALIFFPRREIVELGRRLMAAYNSLRLDILKTILTPEASLEQLGGGTTLNDAVFSSLGYHREYHGVMITAYVRFNDVVYSEVPYINDCCYIDFSVSQQNKIERIKFNPLDERYRELYITHEFLLSHPTDDIPDLEQVEFLPPSERSRFSMLLQFKNGETRRYDAPGDFGSGDPVKWRDETFTDKIFRNGRICDTLCTEREMFYWRYPQNYPGVEFINGASVPTVELYHNSYPVGKFRYREGAEIFIYNENEEDDFCIGRIRDLDPTDPLYLLDTKTKIATALPQEYQGTPIICYPFCGGYSEGLVMVSTMGKLDLQYHHNRRACAGMWGWLDTELKTVIAPQYVYALNFVNGRAIVCKGEWDVVEKKGGQQYWCENEQWGVIDQQGNEIVPCKFDELYEIDDTDRLYFVHEGGWKSGHYSIYDTQEKRVILELDFDFDIGYMFNECFVAEGDVLVFVDHLPGEGEDLIYAYDLHQKKYVAYKESYKERTYNGQKKVVVNKDGKDIIVF